MAPIVYQMAVGDDAAPPSAGKAQAELKRMKSSLSRWLAYRARTDAVAQPGALRDARFSDEQALANNLAKLLVEAGFASPPSNVAADPDAARKLAELVLSDEVASPQSQGFWFLLIPVAGLVLVLSYYIKSQADLAAEKERIRCIQSGACTDYGFWLKIGGISLAAWLAWEKFGLKEAAKKIQRKAS